VPSPIGPLEGPALYIDIGRRLSSAQREMLVARASGGAAMRVRSIGGIGETGFLNMYDEMAVMRAIHQLNFDLKPL
jgi:hypothetical protein